MGMSGNTARCRHTRIVWYSDGEISLVNGHAWAKCLDCDATTMWVTEDEGEDDDELV